MQKIKYPILFIFIISFIRCYNKVNSEYVLYNTHESCKIDRKIDSLYTVFLSGMDSENINEMFIDKTTLEEKIIVFNSRVSYDEYFNTHKPLFFTLINNRRVFVYSGLEDIFEVKEPALINLNNANYINDRCWRIVINKKDFIVDTLCGPPFMPYSAPEEVIDDSLLQK